MEPVGNNKGKTEPSVYDYVMGATGSIIVNLAGTTDVFMALRHLCDMGLCIYAFFLWERIFGAHVSVIGVEPYPYPPSMVPLGCTALDLRDSNGTYYLFFLLGTPGSGNPEEGADLFCYAIDDYQAPSTRIITARPCSYGEYINHARTAYEKIKQIYNKTITHILKNIPPAHAEPAIAIPPPPPKETAEQTDSILLITDEAGENSIEE